MKIEVRINDKLWIEIELDDALGNGMVQDIDQAFSKVVTDKNREKIMGFVRDPKALR